MTYDWNTLLFHEGRPVDFLHPHYLIDVCAALRFPGELAEALREEAERIALDNERTETARRFHSELFIDKRPSAEVNQALLALGPDSALLAAVVYMGALPALWQSYAKRSIPASVFADTLQDVVIWMEIHRRKHGRFGLSQLNWINRHMSGELYKIGRLQYHFIRFPYAVKAFRNKRSGETTCLSDSGIRYRADGWMDGTNGIYDPQDCWESVYAETGREFRGNRITPDGSVSPAIDSLSAAEWELVLEQGDNVLNVHIPEGERLSPELCSDSYQQAAAFASGCFPDIPYKGFVCESWLLGPQLRKLLPVESNIVRFQNDYTLVPVKSDEAQTLERVFGFGTIMDDLPNVPTDTSLQRTVFHHLASGGLFHNGGGFILKSVNV